MMRRPWFAAALAALSACNALPFAPTPTALPTPTLPPPLVIYADNALANALRDIRTAYDQTHPQPRIDFTFAEPADLSTRIENTLRPEVLITTNARIFQDLQARDRLTIPPHVLVRDPLIVFIARTNPAGIERIEDLNRTDIRVVIAAENTRLGQATRALVENFRTDAAFGPDFPAILYHDVIAQPASGSEILQRVVLNRADVGIVYASEADLQREQIMPLVMTAGLGISSDYSVAVLQSALDPARANQFIEFLTTPQAKTIWRDYGFDLP